ncbi:MAG: alanyl-tRNA editing protein [Pseudomonadota bacterium]
MTQTALYREDAYLTAAPARVVAVEEGGVLLDRCLFYPRGGGQPGDRGVLETSAGPVAVVEALKAADGVSSVLTLEEGAAAPAVGDGVTQRLDEGFRRGCMRVHTALHLLSVALPLPVTGGSISPDKGRLDFDMEAPPEDKDALQAALQALIDGDHEVSEEWITDAELEANPGLVKTMAVKPPMGHGRVRLVRIGRREATVDLQPCGGTHVRSTGEIGRVRIGKIEKKGKRNRRVNLHLEP